MFERWRKRLTALVGEPNRAAPEALADAQAASGLTVREFAEQHGLKYTTFRNWVQRRQRERRRREKSRRFTPNERRAAVEAFVKSGRTRNDFAKLWGCSPSSLDKSLKRYRDEGPRGLETRTAKQPADRRAHPRKLSDAVRAQILDVQREHADFGVTRIANHLERFHGVRAALRASRRLRPSANRSRTCRGVSSAPALASCGSRTSRASCCGARTGACT